MTSVSSRRPAKRTKLTTKASYTRAPLRKTLEIKRAQSAIIPSGTTITSAGAIVALPLVAAGDEDDMRNGRSIRVTGFQGRVRCLTSNQFSYHTFRVVYVLWKQALQAPSIGDILDSTGTSALMGTYNITQANNYTILSDKTYHADAQVMNIAAGVFGEGSHVASHEQNVSFLQNYSDLLLGTVQDKAMYVIIAPVNDLDDFECNAAVSFVDI